MQKIKPLPGTPFNSNWHDKRNFFVTCPRKRERRYDDDTHHPKRRTPRLTIRTQPFNPYTTTPRDDRSSTPRAPDVQPAVAAVERREDAPLLRRAVPPPHVPRGPASWRGTTVATIPTHNALNTAPTALDTIRNALHASHARRIAGADAMRA